MSRQRYEIPDNINELFTDDSHYVIVDYDMEMDNNEAMAFFIECAGIREENIILDHGTQVHFSHPNFNYHIVVDSSGMGDFFSHQFEVTKVEFTDYISEIPLSSKKVTKKIAEIARKKDISPEEGRELFEFIYT